VNRVLWNQLVGDVLDGLSFVEAARALTHFKTEWKPVLWPVVAFSKTSFKHRSIQIKGNFTKLTFSVLTFKWQ